MTGQVTGNANMVHKDKKENGAKDRALWNTTRDERRATQIAFDMHRNAPFDQEVLDPSI